MKKFILMIMCAICSTVSFAQNEYVGSKFTDNWSVNVQGGITTPTTHDFFKHVSPVVSVGADKYVNPWLGFGVEGRTAIAAPSGHGNPHTMFDAVNVSGLAKFNILHMFNPETKKFEPVVFTGIGWGHDNCEHTAYNGGKPGHHNNYMTYVAGAELNYNVNKHIGIVLQPDVRWGDINNGKLNRNHGHFEVTAGVKYNFGPGWKRHHCPKPKDIYHKEIVTKEVVKKVPAFIENTFVIQFAYDSDKLSSEAEGVLNGITAERVSIVAFASPEGSKAYNQALSNRRANAVKKYLENRGIKVLSAEGVGAATNESNRIAIITIR